MNSKLKSILHNFSHTLVSNLVSFLISVLVIAVVPKLIGVEAYGYWQLYMFYILYVGFLHFGWCDGIYLRYGGDTYKDLNKGIFHSQYYSLLVLQVFFAVIIYLFAVFKVDVPDKSFVLRMTALSLVAINMRWMLMYILQATNRIKEYANAVMIERLLYLVLLVIALLFGVRNYRVIIWADVIGKYASLAFGVYVCRDFILKPISSYKTSFVETWENISVGSQLMFSNIASMLIIGSVRFGIERFWDVSTFGKVSLTLSISNMLMLFINAMGLVLYPVLRRTNQDNLSKIYLNLRDVLMPILFIALLLYYPIKEVMVFWLPKYADSLIYMALLFPIFIFEGKMALLINTYLKTLRKEKVMLQINLITFLLSVIVTILLSVVWKNLDALVASILCLLAIRSVLLEIKLSRFLGISVLSNIILELMMALVFVLTAWYVDSWLTPVLYSCALLVYLILKRSNIKASIISVKQLSKKKD